jgi:hypothetical protein
MPYHSVWQIYSLIPKIRYIPTLMTTMRKMVNSSLPPVRRINRMPLGMPAFGD